jgi:hypothetical protein
MRLRASVIALSLLVPAGVLADAYGTVQEEAKTFRSVLTQQAADMKADADAAVAEASPDFFAVVGSGAVSSRPTDPALQGVVTFRLGGVPYPLKDVPLTAWFAPYVGDMADRGIVTGYRDANGIPTGYFRPEQGVTLEELAKMAAIAAGLGQACGVPKNPLAQQSWSAGVIACAEQHGLAVYADGTADITRKATRAEVVMTVLQAFGAPLRDLTGPSPFTDVTPSTLFSSAIYTATQDGVVSGYTDALGKSQGIFGPENPVNRAEASKMISLAIQAYKH